MSDTQARKIFISYKYADKHVRQIDNYNYTHWLYETENGNYLTARDYVDHLINNTLKDHINKAEKDNEDLSLLSEETIKQKLYDRIYDSSVTIVLISKKMKEDNKTEKNQWIPRELSYSLQEKTRDNRTSTRNGIIALILPDENGIYDHGIVHKNCVTIIQTNYFFDIISENMFNLKSKNLINCQHCRDEHHTGYDHSYIYPVKWDDFIEHPNDYIEHVISLRDSHLLNDTHKLTIMN